MEVEMDVVKNLKLLILIPFSILFAACATESPLQATHFWQAKEAKTQRDYKIDNGNCQDSNGIKQPATMQQESPSFEAYRDCMVEKGYVLRTYH